MSDSGDLKQTFFYSVFRQLCAIPRESGNEKAVSDYLVAFAKAHNLICHRDEFYNVIIQKPAGEGGKNFPPLFLQAHMDMVCEKIPESAHDFSKDGIEIIEDGDTVRANGTSLGADNGIGIAMILQILNEKFEHPPITAIFTSDEERGLVGVKNLDLSPYEGRTLINLDGEQEGVFLSSCAGGVRCPIWLKIKKEPYKKNENLQELRIAVQGIKGGHSGLEIDKEHGNAILLLGQVLRRILKTENIFLLDISGGNKENSIPSSAQAVIAFYSEQAYAVKQCIAQKTKEIKAEYAASDPGIQIEAQPAAGEYAVCVSRQSLDKLLLLLLLLPNGLIKKDIAHDAALVSSNLGVLKLDDEAVLVSSMIRSNIDSAKYAVVEQFEGLASVLDVKIELKNDYPAWEYNPRSRVREVAINIFEAEFGSRPLVQSIHGGLECAYFAQKRPDIDMLSLGCNLYDVHSVNEHFSVSSATRTYRLLKRILENFME